MRRRKEDEEKKRRRDEEQKEKMGQEGWSIWERATVVFDFYFQLRTCEL